MAFTTEQLEKLEAAIARGVRTVSYNGESVTYNSLSEMQNLRAQMRAELGLGTRDKNLFPTFVREV